jgi:hypothetical protein
MFPACYRHTVQDDTDGTTIWDACITQKVKSNMNECTFFHLYSPMFVFSEAIIDTLFIIYKCMMCFFFNYLSTFWHFLELAGGQCGPGFGPGRAPGGPWSYFTCFQSSASNNPLCGRCADGFSEWGNECVACSSVNAGLWFFLVLLIWIVVLVYHAISQVTTGSLRITIYFWQTAILLLGQRSWLDWASSIGLPS